MTLKDRFFFPFIAYIILHGGAWLLLLNETYNFIQGTKFIFLKSSPYLLFIGLFYRREISSVFKIPIVNLLGRFFFYLAILISALTPLGLIFNQLSVIEIIGLKWTTNAFSFWIIAFWIFYFLLRRSKAGKIESLILSFLAVMIAGYFYEIPVYPGIDISIGVFYHRTHLFYVNNRIILAPLLFWYLAKRFQFNFLAVYLGCIGFLNIAMVYGALGNASGIGPFIPRLSSVVLFVSMFAFLKLKPDPFK